MEHGYINETTVNLVSWLCLGFLAALILWVAANYIIKRLHSRSEGISYIREFKQGKCAAVFLPALALYITGIFYSSGAGLDQLFTAIEKTLKLITLSYDTSNISVLMAVSQTYRLAVQACFSAVLLNAIVFLISLASQWGWSFWKQLQHGLTFKDKLVLVGSNPENRMIYQSEHRRSGILVEEVAATGRKQQAQDKDIFYMQNIAFRYVPSLEQHIRWLLQLATFPTAVKLRLRKIFLPGKQAAAKDGEKKQREWILVINTLDDQRNITLCNSIAQQIGEFEEEVQSDLYQKFKVFVFGDARYEAIYGDLTKRSHGCIQYVNKYQKVAIDFIDRYPFTKFMDHNQVDYATSLVKEDVDIHTIFLGFGRTNQQIFLTSVANNQFLTGSEENPVIKPVHYHIFDKDPAENNKNLNHSYYRYKNECCDAAGNFRLKQEEYLPAPDLPAQEHYYHLDINAKDFYDTLRRIVSQKPNNLHFMVIAYGSDLENLDMAQKLVEKRREWGIANLAIFVKIRSWCKEQTLLKTENCYFFGHEENVVYNIETILGDDLFHMAQLRNEVYDLEYNIVNEPKFVLNEESIRQNHYKANRGWYQDKNQLQRESSLYCGLSLRSKLNLMGLDYCKKANASDKGMSNEEYLGHYAGDDQPDTRYYSLKANGKDIVHYALPYAVSRRRSMAIHEHLRWNAFEISKGVIPATLDQILKEKDQKGKYTNGKSDVLRRHGNLTTFDGLVQFRMLVATRNQCSEDQADVIKYDYQLLDDAHWLLEKLDYKIIPHTKLQ